MKTTTGKTGSTRDKDWRRTIGMFTDNPGMKELFAEAMKLRAADRKKARCRAPKGSGGAACS